MEYLDIVENFDRFNEAELAALALERAQKVGFITHKRVNGIVEYSSCDELTFIQAIRSLISESAGRVEQLANRTTLIEINRELGSRIRAFYAFFVYCNNLNLAMNRTENLLVQSHSLAGNMSVTNSQVNLNYSNSYYHSNDIELNDQSVLRNHMNSKRAFSYSSYKHGDINLGKSVWKSRNKVAKKHDATKMRCFICRTKGHIAKNCWHKTPINKLKDREKKEDECNTKINLLCGQEGDKVMSIDNFATNTITPNNIEEKYDFKNIHGMTSPSC